MEKKTIIDLFESSAKRFPSNPFLWEKTGKRFEPTTYSEVRDLVYEEGAASYRWVCERGIIWLY